MSDEQHPSVRENDEEMTKSIRQGEGLEEIRDTLNETKTALTKGPVDPRHSVDLNARPKNVLTGHIEVVTLSNADFERERRRPQEGQKGEKMSKKKRITNNDPTDMNYLGSWGGYEGEKKDLIAVPTEEEVNQYMHEKSRIVPATLTGNIALGQERSIFHGKEECDYLGRTYMSSASIDGAPLLDKEPGSFDCYAPKTLIHTWTGHTKGVNAIRLLPKTGHLLLSAGQDQRIKLWDVYRKRECLRTFYGHNKPVREIAFDSNGSHFASCSYDKTFKHWDTETGQCTLYQNLKTIPYCIRIHPTDSNAILVGTADRRIMQWDSRTNQVVCEYSGHNAAVNSITFFGDKATMVSSCDDKALRVFDYGVPAPFKKISDPEMPSMPFAAVHPTEESIVFQSLSNEIYVYSFNDGLTLRPKRFIGHATQGYACQVSFSPDGKYLISGDGRGQLVIWNWATGKIARQINAHPQVCIGAEWNPQEPSRIVTCSWDGTIKYWD
jgi:pre-mRNA-processing factor 17